MRRAERNRSEDAKLGRLARRHQRQILIAVAIDIEDGERPS